MLQRAPIVTTIDLPVPPSVNRTRRAHWKGHEKIRAWHQHADVLIMAKRARSGLAPMPNRFEVTVIFSESATRLDLDNGLKALIDYLRRIELVIDDSPKYMRRIVVEWGTAPQGCRVQLREVA